MNIDTVLPAPEPKKAETLIVPIDSGLKDELRKIARDTGLSMAEITRRWLSYGVEQSNRADEERPEQSA